MERTRKTAAPPESAQESRDELEMNVDTPGAQEAAEGVFADEPPLGEWVCVTTGLLSGYMRVKHLAPLTAELKMAIAYD